MHQDIIQMQITTEKIKFIVCLVLGEIKYCNLKKVHIEEKNLFSVNGGVAITRVFNREELSYHKYIIK